MYRWINPPQIFKFFLAALIAASLVNSAQASVSDNEISSAISEKLDKLQTQEAWKDFVAANADKFSKDPKESSVKVDKLPIQIKGETFTLGVGFRQIFLRTTIDRAKALQSQPSLFKFLFGLDKESQVGDVGDKFRARIFKKVPVISDQDYILEYHNFESGNIWFQRASMVEDKKEFALRDNLKTLTPVGGGVIFRELSYVYILRWYLRALGPQVRTVMVDELSKLNRSIKCAAESEKPISNELGAECWKSAQ